MKLKEVKLQNFRGYRDEVTITFENMTVLIGRNDAGKSSILDALDIFFNDANIEKEDACVYGDASEVRISCIFSDLPDQVILDDLHPTTLQKEYLTRPDGQLEVCRVFNCSAAKGKQTKIFVRSNHPNTEGCADLMGLKIKELKTRATERGVNLTGVNQTIKTELRQAIWAQTASLNLVESEVDLAVETGKTVWDQIQLHLPVYALFKSDRASTDQDEEAQDPMKAAIKEAIKNHAQQLNNLISQVTTELEALAKKTVEKIQEMSPELAKTLVPQVKNKNWDTLFSVTLSGDDGIAINKRGSGTRRLVLLNFFRAKAEDTAHLRTTGTIYAIEEPETSQHPNHQLMLLDALQELTEQGCAQVILTTHTPTLARKVDRNFLRLVTLDARQPKILLGSEDSTLEAIKLTLGVLPDHDVKVFLGVEGKWDIEFLRRISKMVHAIDPTVPDLHNAELSGALVFIPLGGSSMELWAIRLAGIDRPEVYITDRDAPPPSQPKYHRHITSWNTRANCTAFCTTKRELENYLHPNAIKQITASFPDAIADFDDVPLLLAEPLHTSDANATPWNTITNDNKKEKAKKVKRRLNQEGADNMTVELIAQSDPSGEIIGWLRAVGAKLST